MPEKRSLTGRRRLQRDRVLAVRITAGERAELAKFAEERSVNLSALVRKLLFGAMRNGGGKGG